MTNFLNALREETTKTHTENGALTFSSSLNSNLDFFGQAGSMRGRLPDVGRLFIQAYSEDREIAIRNLIHLRNIRLGGLGERDAFRVAVNALADADKEVAVNLVDYIAYIGRWDDVVALYDYAKKTNNKAVKNATVAVIKNALSTDIQAQIDGNPVSLLAKWLPSPSSSTKAKRELAISIMKDLDVPKGEIGTYRKSITALRTEIGIVEQKLASKDYDAINFEKLPSKALFQYREAFRRHMPERYEDFLEKVEKGEVKMNAGNLLPHEIIRAYSSTYSVDASLEATWKSLDNVLDGIDDNAIVVADTSASMTWEANGLPWQVAEGLAIYTAERLEGAFKGHFITFSTNPKLIKLPNAGTLKDKMREYERHSIVDSTDIQKVFDLILNTAIKNRTSQEDLPSKVVIISDMEFNQGVSGSTNFETAKRKFENAGYKLPDLVFWNVNSRHDNLPVRHDERGVAMVSGFTPNILRQVLGANIVSPEAMMLEVLNSDKYDFVKDIVK